MAESMADSQLVSQLIRAAYSQAIAHTN